MGFLSRAAGHHQGGSLPSGTWRKEAPGAAHLVAKAMAIWEVATQQVTSQRWPERDAPPPWQGHATFPRSLLHGRGRLSFRTEDTAGEPCFLNKITSLTPGKWTPRTLKKTNTGYKCPAIWAHNKLIQLPSQDSGIGQGNNSLPGGPVQHGSLKALGLPQK